MTDDPVEDLLARNADHVAAIDDHRYDDVQDGQSPPVVALSCSDSRVPQEAMFSVGEPGFLFTPSNIGNQARAPGDDGDVVDGNLLYPVEHTGTRTIVVVGHTGCGAVTAAAQAVAGTLDLEAEPPGIQAMVRRLVPVVEGALADLGADPADEGVVDDLVERNVDAQVAFLRDRPEVPDEATVLGFVYDLHGAYGGAPGTAYLVNVDGATREKALAGRAPDRFRGQVRRRT